MSLTPPNYDGYQNKPVSVAPALTLQQRFALLPERVRALLGLYVCDTVLDKADLQKVLAMLRPDGREARAVGYSFAQNDKSLLFQYICREPSHVSTDFNNGIVEWTYDFLCHAVSLDELPLRDACTFAIVWLGHLFQMNATIDVENSQSAGMDPTIPRFSRYLLEHYRLCIELILRSSCVADQSSEEQMCLVRDDMLLELARLNCGIVIDDLMQETKEVIEDIFRQQELLNVSQTSSDVQAEHAENFRCICESVAADLFDGIEDVDGDNLPHLNLPEGIRHVDIGSLGRNVHHISSADLLHKDALDLALLQSLLTQQPFADASEGCVHVFLADMEERAEFILSLLQSLNNDNGVIDVYAIMFHMNAFLGLHPSQEISPHSSRQTCDFRSIATAIGIADYADTVQYYLIEEIFRHLSAIRDLVMTHTAVLHGSQCSQNSASSPSSLLPSDCPYAICMFGIGSRTHILPPKNCLTSATLAFVFGANPMPVPSTLPACTSRELLEGVAGSVVAQKYFAKEWSDPLNTMVYDGCCAVSVPEFRDAFQGKSDMPCSNPLYCLPRNTSKVFIFPSSGGTDYKGGDECGSY